MLPDPIQAAAMAALHHRTARLSEGDPVAEPLVMTSTFQLGDQPPPDAIYGRYETPNVSACEARLAAIEGAPCVLFAAGMGAIAGVMLSGLEQGAKLVLPTDGYMHSRVLARDILTPFGVEVVEIPTPDLLSADLGGASLVLAETPSNPALDLVDIAALADRCRAAGAKLAIDNTFCTGLLQRPLELGADIVIAADTKAAGGHSDLILGHAATNDPALEERLRATRKFAGMIPGPFEAWMLSRSLETLELRLSRMVENARLMAETLDPHVPVTWPGLDTHPDHALALRQMHAPGSVLSATFDTRAQADTFLTASGLVAATSFGGTHSSADRRARWGDAVPDGFLRLSAGIEPSAPLKAALEKGLAEIGKS